jgi:glycosyltransferase involved in cell wall biosynthesis
MPPLADAFARAGVALELVMVDNGSTDGTSAAIDALLARGLPITKATVPVNRGQGLGILTGLAIARGAHVGHVNADGQIAPEDVVRVYTATRVAPRALVKARRLNRPDGIARALVSVVYNAMMQIFFWGMPSRDVNCNPKILPADVLRMMRLSSYDWFLEPEIMLKARHLHLPVVEIDVVSHERQGGRSHVRVATVLEFLRNIMLFRLGGPWRAWRKQVGTIVPSGAG